MHVLIADDDAGGRNLLESVLSSGGHRVSSAGDGMEALDVARADHPDLLISDILMPGMDGYQLCREWKSDPTLCAIPIAFYTASYVDAADERFAEGLGADAFWRKPMDPQQLMRAVASLADVRGAEARHFTDEATVLKEYNARLVGKIEEKAHNLELVNAELRRAMELLALESHQKEQLIAELHQDVSARREVEHELRRERDFSRQVLEFADLFVCILDADLRVTLFSEGAERITGYGAAEITGEEGIGLPLTAASLMEVKHAIRGLCEAGAVSRELDMVAADGQSVRTIDCTLACMPQLPGDRPGYSVFGVDVTERRRLEKMKHELIQMVSHEFRTPLTSILGFVELLGGLPQDKLIEQAPVIVDRLALNALRMRNLVEELLEVNTIAAEGITLARREVDLGHLVRRAAEAVFPSPAHSLNVTVAPGMPKVSCDAERMGRVVTNLVSNAVKYSPDGGPISVDVRCDGDLVAITVSDHGIGIAPSEVPTLFDRFFQGDMSSTRSFAGIGLGLFIVDEIVRAHDGTISVESTPGEGSTFTVRIPRTAP